MEENRDRKLDELTEAVADIKDQLVTGAATAATRNTSTIIPKALSVGYKPVYCSSHKFIMSVETDL